MNPKKKKKKKRRRRRRRRKTRIPHYTLRKLHNMKITISKSNKLRALLIKKKQSINLCYVKMNTESFFCYKVILVDIHTSLQNICPLEFFNFIPLLLSIIILQCAMCRFRELDESEVCSIVKRVEWVYCLFLFPLVLGEMQLSHAKLGLFCVLQIIYFRKTYFFLFLEIKFQNGTHLKKKGLFLTYFSHFIVTRGKLQKFLHHISHSHTYMYFAQPIDFFCLTNFEKNTNLSGMVSLWYDSWC